MFIDLIKPEDTIVAPATAAGISALAVIRVSGNRAIEICSKVFKGKNLNEQKTHTIHYGHIVDGDVIIDEVMLSIFKAPKTYTAEDCVEISCHGSQYIQRQIVNLLVQHGARLAAPGEFTIRAYLNGRIDLAQAEAVGDIIASQNRSQLDLALHQMRGGLSAHLQELRTSLLNFISLVELELDFGEEDVEFADRSQLRQQVLNLIDAIKPVIDSFKYGNAIKNGIPVAIIGRPNAGKSSLLNALLDEDRAIVSEIAGTTRDTIEEEIHIEGVSFRFIDTAGIRKTEDSIEKIGIEKALKKIDEAGIVLYIFDLNETSSEEAILDLEMIESRNTTAEILVLANKSDLVSPDTLEHIMETIVELRNEQVHLISLQAHMPSELQEIRKTLWNLSHVGKQSSQDTIISNERHYQCLKEAEEALGQVIQLMDAHSSSDLLALELKRAVQSIGDITGTITNDEVLGTIFGKFCIGK